MCYFARNWALALAAAVPATAISQRSTPASPPASVVAAERPTSTRPAAREQTADQQVMQVLNRLAFGPRPGEALEVRKIGVDAWIDQQLHPERINDSAMDQLLARYPLLEQNQSELAAQYAQAQRERRMIKRESGDTTQKAGAASAPVQDPAFKQIKKERTQLTVELASERTARAVASNRQLQEVMTDFWENHFNVYARKNAIEPYYLAAYDSTIRAHALGKFRDLLGAVAHSPAMLVYLDNALSRANPGEPTLAPARADGMVLARGLDGSVMNMGRIQRSANFGAGAAQVRVAGANKNKNKRASGLNENYGRELMELHTLGVDGGYTQQDVIEAARALTGWTVRPPAQGGGFIFRPQWHDAGPKTFLGHKLAAGRGEQDGEDVLDIVARSPATAHFIAFKLARRFVSDSPSTALVNAAAQTFMRTDGDIREVVRTIVTSPEFFSERAYHAKVKSPFEVVVSAARALGAQPDTTPRTALAVAYLGEPIFGHQDPNGWPDVGESWMNTGAILTRINFGMAVAAGRLPGASVQGWIGADSLQNASRSAQVDAVVASLLGGAVSPDTRKILMSGEHPLAADAAQVAARQSAQPDTVNETAVPASNAMSDASMTAGQAGQRVKGGAGAKRGMVGGGRNAIVGPAPQLTGLAQVVGLALGSPEFQRR